VKKLVIAALFLSGCFPSVRTVQRECAQDYNPNTNPDLYMHCVDTRMNDINTRRHIMADGFRNAGASMQNSMQNRQVHCTTIYIGTMASTSCQ
jgi:PBP1b-binding outer membrane lipoprotein LpoB